MQQHIGHAVVGNNEAIALGDIKPFDDAGHFDDLSRRVVVKFDVRPEPSRGGFCFYSVRRHDAVTAAAVCSRPAWALHESIKCFEHNTGHPAEKDKNATLSQKRHNL